MAKTLEDRIARAIDKHTDKNPDTTLRQIFDAFCSILDTINGMADRAAAADKIVRHHDEPQIEDARSHAHKAERNFDRPAGPQDR